MVPHGLSRHDDRVVVVVVAAMFTFSHAVPVVSQQILLCVMIDDHVMLTNLVHKDVDAPLPAGEQRTAKYRPFIPDDYSWVGSDTWVTHVGFGCWA